MKKPFYLAAVFLYGAVLVQAGNHTFIGTVISESSVACGSKIDKNKQTVPVLCHEYVVRTPVTEYHVRQFKNADPALIPINTGIEFTIEKDRMRFKVNGKSYEYLIVSEAAAPAVADATRP